jgi:acyl-CoA thioester hydrolase
MRSNEPLPVYETRVAAEWIDHDGHMNDAAYALVFSRALDALMDRIGLDAAQRRASGRSLFTEQAMLHCFAAAGEGEALFVDCHLLEHDAERMRLWFDMRAGRERARVAASEQALLSVEWSGEGARPAPWRAETLAALDALAKAQRNLETSPLAGRGVALRRG